MAFSGRVIERREDVNSSTSKGKIASNRFRAWILASAVAICLSVMDCSEAISWTDLGEDWLEERE